jgi:hypothetical protein
VVILAFIHYFQNHPNVLTYLITGAVIIFIIWAVIMVATEKPKEAKE